MRIADHNVQNVLVIARQLEELTEEMIFLGGAATGLLIDDPGAPELRGSLDVDVVVEVVSRARFYELGEALRSKGFREKPERNICSWTDGRFELDVMPTIPEILGLSNVMVFRSPSFLAPA